MYKLHKNQATCLLSVKQRFPKSQYETIYSLYRSNVFIKHHILWVSRRYTQMHFQQWKQFGLNEMSLKFTPNDTNDITYYMNIRPGNDLPPDRWQLLIEITWPGFIIVNWRLPTAEITALYSIPGPYKFSMKKCTPHSVHKYGPFLLQCTNFTNPGMHMFHIPQCSIQNINVHKRGTNRNYPIQYRSIMMLPHMVLACYYRKAGNRFVNERCTL